MLSEARAEAAPATSPTVPAQAKWLEMIEPNPPLLFRFSAIRFNSHRIHYDRDYVTKIEKLPGLVVQSSLVSQLLMEMCRKELPAQQLKSFDFKSVRQIYDTGKFTIAGNPSADSREAELWTLDSDGRVAMAATAKFA
jgi:3-methylfumaryl-CoA hydratase